MRSRSALRDLILCSILSALVVVMTVVPYTGYITVGGTLEITTLHVVTILAGVLLGWKYGAIVGGVWGLSCIARCLIALPIYKAFGFANIFVAFLPRVCVGLFSGLLFSALKKTKLSRTVSIMISAIGGSLTNTVLVLTAMTVYCRVNGVAGYEAANVFSILQGIVTALAAVNGMIELAAAIILVPAVYFALLPKETVLGIDIGASTTKLALVRGKKCLKTLLKKDGETLEESLDRFAMGHVDRVAVTGVGASYLEGKVRGLPTNKVDEFTALSWGLTREAGIHNCLAVSVGTGTSFMRISPLYSYHMGGTGMGGGMLLGMSRALCGTEDMREFVDFAQKGDLTRVDLVLKDVSRGTVSNLKPDTTVANFGKLNALSSKEDVALGIYNLVFQSIGVMAAFASKGLLTRKIVLMGTITEYPGAPAILEEVAKLHRVKFVIPEKAGFIGAMGAAMV